MRFLKFYSFIINGLLLITPCYADSTPGASSDFHKAASSETVKQFQAMGRKVTDWSSPDFKTKLEFKFDGVTGELRENGDIFIEGGVQHRGLLCGTYQLGIQFGTGTAACTDITWITEVYYLTKVTHCNNAFLFHKGTDLIPELAASFDKVNCARLSVKCTGNCK